MRNVCKALGAQGEKKNTIKQTMTALSKKRIFDLVQSEARSGFYWYLLSQLWGGTSKYPSQFPLCCNLCPYGCWQVRRGNARRCHTKSSHPLL